MFLAKKQLLIKLQIQNNKLQNFEFYIYNLKFI